MEFVSDLNNLYFFKKVVDHGSYTAAGLALGIQTSKLSRRVMALEKELKVRLLNRTSRRISLTDAGTIFYRHCTALVEEAQAAKSAMEQTLLSPQGIIRMSCPLGLLQSWVSQAILEYLEENPSVRIVLDATNRRVDVVEEGIDIAIRVRVPPLEDSDLTKLSLTISSRVLVANPQLLSAHPPVSHVADLIHLPSIAMAHAGGKYTWDLTESDGSPLSVTHFPRLATDDLSQLRKAALRGIGIAQLPMELVSADIESGRLERLLPAHNSATADVHAVYPSRRGMVPAIRSMLDKLATTARAFPSVFGHNTSAR